jgi:hypothetical protein
MASSKGFFTSWKRNAIALIGILIFAAFIITGYAIKETAYVPDSFGFIFLVLFLYFFYDTLNLNLAIYIILILGFIPHSLGVLGYYAQSPIFLQWDHFTHFVPLFAFALLFFRTFQSNLTKRLISRKNFILFVCIFLTALGAGAIIETLEFSGFLMLGFGEGGFRFGTGDAFGGEIVSATDIDAFGGGWFNTMWDLIWNMIGAFAGLIVMIYFHFFYEKKKANLKIGDFTR